MLMLALLLAVAGPQCNREGSQIELDVCADQDAKAADAALNRVWATTIARARKMDGNLTAADRSSGPPSADALLKAQRTWLSFRDAECLAEALEYRGGSMMPMIESACAARLTKARTKDLQTAFGEN